MSWLILRVVEATHTLHKFDTVNVVS